ncbi:TnsD family Tn7-like transposition protein [Parachitinimonas caeni]|uniref:TnsD family Tn7-like transposition protein n=1 Tax=Parachitinimonas caeni TaxID=3031301 RepID=A0ABT7DSL8_9NEIS|nr:TnsD family Tn7-like transposition protein [Parachitinimonas caeni]MDK2123062.1 TnsD family Tn7-like transposition protein [Parachitinimonas caeni]
MVKQSAGNVESARIGDQVRQLLKCPNQPSPAFSQWTHYYQSLAHLNGLSRGDAQINHHAVSEMILQAWSAAWLARNNLASGVSGYGESDWLRAMFRKHRKGFSYLEHIIVNYAFLGNNFQIVEVLEKVRQYPVEDLHSQIQTGKDEDQGLSIDQEDWLHHLKSYLPKQARVVSPALYARLYRRHRDWLQGVNSRRHIDGHVLRRIGRLNWGERDREYLDMLLQCAKLMKSDQAGPRRSRAYYLRMIGSKSTIEKNLHRMPLSQKFLVTHSESVEQYQIRRLKNAYRALRKQFDVPPRWRLLRAANLSEERLADSAKKYLEELEI